MTIFPLLSALVQIVELNKGNLQMRKIEHFVKLRLTFIVKLFLFSNTMSGSNLPTIGVSHLTPVNPEAQLQV